MKYNPEKAPDPETWRALEETQRLDSVSAYHSRMRVKVPNVDLHAAIHVIVENQLAEGFALATDALDRLMAEGLNRHEAIHAIGSVLMGHVWNLLRGDAKAPDPNAPYCQALQTLTASSWREEFGTTRKRIPHGTKLSITLTVRERDLIRDETFCNPDFAKCAVVEGTGIRVELSLDETEDIQGYVAEESNHTKNATHATEVKAARMERHTREQAKDSSADRSRYQCGVVGAAVARHAVSAAQCDSAPQRGKALSQLGADR